MDNFAATRSRVDRVSLEADPVGVELDDRDDVDDVSDDVDDLDDRGDLDDRDDCGDSKVWK